MKKKQYTDEDRARWQAAFDAQLELSLPEAEAKALALKIYREGRGVQVSRRYRMIATLPEGETGLKALKRCSPTHYKRVMASAERSARQDYATYCASKDGQMHELDMRTFAEFKKLENGETFQLKESDLRATEDPYGLSDPAREARIRLALLELDKAREGK